MPTVPYPTLSYGEVDPRLAAQVTHEIQAKGCEKGRNVLFLAQGGFTWRPGLRYIATLPNSLTAIDLSGATPTAPKGGTAANGIDGSDATDVLSTGAIGTVDPYVLLSVDLGADTAVLFADVENLRTTTATVSEREWVVEYATAAAPATFVAMGPSAFYQVDDTARTRRFTGPVVGRYFRVVRIGGTDLGTSYAALTNLRLWGDSGQASETRALAFEFNPQQRYLHLLTDRNLRVLQDDAWVCDVPSPFTAAQLGEFGTAAQLDTRLGFHEQVAPHRWQRQGADDVWDSRPVPFTKVPTSTFGRRTTNTGSPGATTGDTIGFIPGKELVNLTADTSAGTRTITLTAGNTDQLEVGQLISVSTGSPYLILTVQTITDSTHFTVDKVPDTIGTGTAIIAGELKASDVGRYLRMANGLAKITAVAAPNSGTLNIIVPFDSAEPVDPGAWSIEEEAWSAARGWPGVGVFESGTLWAGRTPDLPQTVWRAKAKSPFDFDNSRSDVDFGFERTPESPQVPRITAIVAGPYLQVLTTRGFFYIPTSGEPITPTNAALRMADTRGAKIGVPALSIEGATVFVERDGQALRIAAFDANASDSYAGNSLSRYSAHLIVDPVDLAYLQGTADQQGNYLWAVNSDGSLYAQCLVAEEQVRSVSLLSTDGLFKNVCVDNTLTYLVVQRTIGGAAVRFLEKMDATLHYDAAISGSGAASTLTGLQHLEGQLVGLTVDGMWQPQETVASGAVTPDRAAVATYQAGLPWPGVGYAAAPTASAWVRPRTVDSLSGDLMGVQKRIVNVVAEYSATQGIYLAGERVSFQQMGAPGPLDVQVPPFTGQKRTFLEPQWDVKPYVDFLRVDPLPATVLGFALEVRT